MDQKKRKLWAIAALVLMVACEASGTAVPDAGSRTSDDVVRVRPQKDVDVLFVMDNSPSISPQQQAMAAAIPGFIRKIDATGANYQIGIVTTDIGSWAVKGTPWPISLGTCNSFEGDDGALQRVACNSRQGLSAAAVAACQALCPDPKFVPEGNAGFIRKVNGVSNVPKSLDPMTMQDIGPQKAFQCLALVGDNGCGIEGPLESARRALDGHLAANKDFLRQGSVLSVIFLTNEDDCSVSLAGRKENNPTTRACGAADMASDCFNPDYRCLARSTVCDQSMSTRGIKTNCKERPTSYLEPVDTYVNFFANLRVASKLLISGIYTKIPVNDGGKVVIDYERNGTTSPELNRANGADAACINAQDPSIFGRPQHRLSKFTRRFKDSLEVDVCDTSNYANALDAIAVALKVKLSVSCLSVLPKLVDSGGRKVPACLVGDVSEKNPNGAPAQAFPPCSDRCCGAWSGSLNPTADEPNIKAVCAAETSTACFCAVAPQGAAAAAGLCQGQAIAGVIRQAGIDSAPPETVVNFKCLY